MPQIPDCPHCQDKVCKHDGTNWVKKCSGALAEDIALATRWAEQYAHPFVVSKTTYHGQARAEAERNLREELA
jgi:hypothetical protein